MVLEARAAHWATRPGGRVLQGDTHEVCLGVAGTAAEHPASLETQPQGAIFMPLQPCWGPRWVCPHQLGTRLWSCSLWSCGPQVLRMGLCQPQGCICGRLCARATCRPRSRNHNDVTSIKGLRIGSKLTPT